jgi:two-component system, LytTR family, sensor kinase
MRRSLFFIFAILCACLRAHAQVQWSDTAISPASIGWENYSTTYLGDGADSLPLLVTAIPYNGIYNFGDRNDSNNKPLDMSFNGSAYRFRSNLSDHQIGLETFDSTDVYFLAPGIFKSNANQFEFRVMLNDKVEMQGWAAIRNFTAPDFTINSFRPGFAFLGGFKAPFNNYIVVELRRKKSAYLLSSTAVFWRMVKPELNAILTSKEMNEKILQLPNSFSQAKLPTHLVLPAGETDLFFF